jgi:hypothetical protein
MKIFEKVLLIFRKKKFAMSCEMFSEGAATGKQLSAST